jgi:hypothetical protein
MIAKTAVYAVASSCLTWSAGSKLSSGILPTRMVGVVIVFHSKRAGMQTRTCVPFASRGRKCCLALWRMPSRRQEAMTLNYCNQLHKYLSSGSDSTIQSRRTKRSGRRKSLLYSGRLLICRAHGLFVSEERRFRVGQHLEKEGSIRY